MLDDGCGIMDLHLYIRSDLHSHSLLESSSVGTKQSEDPLISHITIKTEKHLHNCKCSLFIKNLNLFILHLPQGEPPCHPYQDVILIGKLSDY